MNGRFPRLVWWELRKNFRGPWVPLFLAILLLTNAWKLQWEYRDAIGEFTEYEPVYQDFYSRWKGAITQEKVGQLMRIYGPLEEKWQTLSLQSAQGTGQYTGSENQDYRFFASQFAEEMKYDYFYASEASRIVSQARALGDFYADLGNTYEAKKNDIISGLFSRRAIPDFADTRYLEVWLSHDYSAMVVLLLCLFGLGTVFVTERETEMYMLLRTTRLGGSAAAAAKLTASLLYVVTVCVLFFGEDFLVLQLLSGNWDALRSPVYAIRPLEASPLTVTAGQFILWSGAVKTLGVAVCGCGILLFSCLSRQVLTAFVSGFGYLMAMVLLQENARNWAALKWMNPMELVMIRELAGRAVFVNVLGIPVPLYRFVLFGVSVTGAALLAGVLLTSPGRMERGRRHA